MPLTKIYESIDNLEKQRLGHNKLAIEHYSKGNNIECLREIKKSTACLELEVAIFKFKAIMEA